MKILIKTLGCRLNQAESDKIAEKITSFGVEVDLVPTGRKADLYIVNTCCITEKAVTKSKKEINKIRNRHKLAKILVCGCARELKSEANFFMKDKDKIPKFIYNKFIENKRFVHNNTNNLFRKGKTRAFIKIQDGCNNFCSYCIIPYIRKKMISVPSSQVLKEIKGKEEAGFKEIVLTGVNIGKYKDKNLNLEDLVRKILKETNILRIRFGSINPELINNEFISLFKDKRVCSHLHLSLQSGSDSVLKKMKRNYITQEYLDVAEKIREKYTDFNFTTDIIVGFPGESDKEFKETCDFVRKIRFSRIHVFPYSKRKGTLAEKMNKQVNYNIREKRILKLKQINRDLERKFQERMIGRKGEVLLENKQKDYSCGFTKNYFKVKLESKENLKNKVKIIKISKNNLTI